MSRHSSASAVFHAQPTASRRGSRGPAASSAALSNALKCPELLLRGVEMQVRAILERLEKKGKRFESPWLEFRVAVYAGILFYYDDLQELPRGMVPLVACTVKPVDRIFKTNDADGEVSAENCGPCFKITSSANRVLLFRCDDTATRDRWVRHIQYCSGSDGRVRGSSTAGLGPPAASTPSSQSSSDEASRSRSLSPSRTLPTRFSLDETNIRKAQTRRASQTPPTSEGSTPTANSVEPKTDTKADANAVEPIAAETEISEMLRDAMAMVKKQKLEILELRRALEEARQEARTSSIVARPSDTEEVHSPPVHSPPVSTPSSSADEPLPTESHETVASPGTTTATTPALPSPPTVPVDATTTPAPAVSPSFGPVDANTSDYLQKQAMELAEIARYLQLTFQNDVLVSTKQITSLSSTSPTETIDHVNSAGSNDSDQLSEAGDESDGERLSVLEETEVLLPQSDTMLDSIQKVMRDFPSPSNTRRTKSEQFIIDDDVIAEIRHGVSADKKRGAFNLMDPSALRSLRSRSACDGEYKLSLSPQSIARTHSAREFSIDDFSSPAPISKHRKRVPIDLVLLVVEDNMAVVSSILQTASRDEKTSLLLPLLRVFHNHNRLSRLIRWAIESEVASVINVATLFRSDDYASRLVSTYSKSIGSNYLKLILVEPIQEIYKLKLADIDLTMAKHEEDPDSELIRRNADNLMNACQSVLDSIFAHRSDIPLSYFHICSHLNAKVINRFDGSMEGLAVEDPASLTRSVVGGFLFLRFVCPAIATPHLHDLTDKEPTSETRRILVLITKLLFKTATSVLFNDKEAHLRVLNPFIERNSRDIQQLFSDMAIAPAESIDECFSTDSHTMFANLPPNQPELDIAVIRRIAVKNFDAVEKKLSVSGCSPTTVENLRFSLEAFKGDDPSVASKGIRTTKKLNMKFLTGFSKIVRKQQPEA